MTKYSVESVCSFALKLQIVWDHARNIDIQWPPRGCFPGPSTMYYHIERDNIPATKRGKNYILFKDELVGWLESGRKSPVALSPEEMNAQKLSSIKRKPRRFGNWWTNGISTFLILMTDQCHVTVIGRLCDVCTGEGKSIQTHLLLFRTYTTEPLIQWHSNVNTTNVALSVRMRHGSTNDNIISYPITKQK